MFRQLPSTGIWTDCYLVLLQPSGKICLSNRKSSPKFRGLKILEKKTLKPLPRLAKKRSQEISTKFAAGLAVEMILHKVLESNQPCYFTELRGNKQGILTTHLTKKSKWLKPYVETLCKAWYFNKYWMCWSWQRAAGNYKRPYFCEAFTSAKEVSGEIGCSEAYTTLLQTNIAGWKIHPFWWYLPGFRWGIFHGLFRC